MLENRNLNVALSKGLDTKTDPKQIVAGYLTTLQNVIFKTVNQLRKRFGYTAITNSIISGSTISAGVQNGTFNNEYLTADGSSLYAYSSTAVKQINRGSMPILNITTSSAVSNSHRQLLVDSCYLSGYYLYAYEDYFSGSVRGVLYTIVDANGTVVVPPTSLGASTLTRPRCVAFPDASAMMIFYIDSATATLYFQYVLTATPTTISSPTTVTTSIPATASKHNFDAIYVSGNARVYTCWNNNTTGVTFLYVNTSFAISTSQLIGTYNADICLTITSDASNNIWAGYSSTTSTRVVIVNAALGSVVLASTQVNGSQGDQITGIVSGTTGTFYVQSTNASPTDNTSISSVTITTAGTVGAYTLFQYHAGLAGKLFAYNSVNYLVVVYPNKAQSSYFIINASSVVVARYSQNAGAGILLKASVPAVNQISAGVYQFSELQVNLFAEYNGTAEYVTGVQTYGFSFTSATSVSASLGNNTFFTGGFLWGYDGLTPVEDGFHVRPAITATATTGGGTLTAGTYSLVATYEWVDSQGQTHKSTPSDPVSVTLTTDTKITATVTTLGLTQKLSPVQCSIILYATDVNGTLYYQVSDPLNPTANTLAAANVDIVFSSLASFTANIPLYTNGGEVANDPAYPMTLLSTFQSRMIANVIGHPLQYQFTKQVIPGSPVEWASDFVFNLDSRIGSFSAGLAMDDKYVFYGPTTIFYMVGSGPSPNGTNNDFTTPQLVASDCGCANPASVVLTPDGIIFQTPNKGIYILDRSLQVSYIGYGIEAFNSYTVTSAVLVKNQNQVRFTMSNGSALTYDYLVKQWEESLNISAVGATLWNSNYTYLKSVGTSFYEDTTIYNDNGTAINMKFTTSWMSFADLQGYQRVRYFMILGEYVSAHTLTVNIYYDYSTSIGQAVTIPVSANPAPYEFRIPITQQKCTAIRFEIIESQSGSGGESFKLSNLAVQVGVKKGLNKLPAANTYGS